MSSHLPCPASILFMLDEGEERKVKKESGVQQAYTNALQDALKRIAAAEEENQRPVPPSPGNLPRELRLQQQKQVNGGILCLNERHNATRTNVDNSSKSMPAPRLPIDATVTTCIDVQPPNSSLCTAASKISKAIELSTADFLDLTSELERLNDDFKRLRCSTGEQDSRFLVVDAFDVHAAEDVRDKVLRSKIEEAKVHYDTKSYSLCAKVLTELCEVTVSERLNPFIFQNIAACYYCLEEWDMAMHATRRALEFNSSLDVGYRRLFRIFLITERMVEAKALLEANKRKSYWSGEVAAMKAYTNYVSLYDSHLYTYCMRELEALIRIIPCSPFESLKVQLLSLDSSADAVRYANERLHFYPKSIDLKYWRSELQYRLASSSSALEQVLEEFEVAVKETKDIRFRNGMKSVLHSMEVVKRVETMLAQARGGVNENKSNKWAELIAYCTAELKSSFSLHDGLLQCLLSARCRAYLQEKNWYAAMDDVSKALHYAEEEASRGELLLLKASCEAGLHRWQDAVTNAEKAARMLRTPASEHQLNDLRAALLSHRKKVRNEEERRFQSQQKKHEDGNRQNEEYTRKHWQYFPKGVPPSSFSDSDDETTTGGYDKERQKANQTWEQHESSKQKQASYPHRLKDAFKVLSLNPTQDETEVRKTYRALALKWHPDKWSGKTDKEKEEAEKRFKDIQNAYESIMSTLKG